jgi:hypothetical protein
MSDTNGAVDFTHQLTSFKLEGHEFRRRKIPPRLWAETLAQVATEERTEMAKKEGSQLFAVSGDGLAALIRLAVREEDREKFDQMYADGLIEFGELTALRDWVWEEMTARPFTLDTSSSDGPGTSTEASSTAESSSPVEVRGS